VRKVGAVIGLVAPFMMIWSPSILILTLAATAGYVAQMLCVVPRASSIIQRAAKSSPIEYMTVAFIGAYAPKLVYSLILIAVASSGVNGVVLLNFSIGLGAMTTLFYYKNL
jgi:hypothetical protein